MNFKGNHRREPQVSMQELANRIKELPQDRPSDEVRRFAPPAIRDAVPPDGPVIDHIAKFGELPTKELDDIILAAEEEIVALKRDAQAVRDLYHKYTTKLANDIKRLREGVRLGMDTMRTLREQCVALDNDLKQFEKPDEPAKTPHPAD